jgi:hypothetical protein
MTIRESHALWYCPDAEELRLMEGFSTEEFAVTTHGLGTFSAQQQEKAGCFHRFELMESTGQNFSHHTGVIAWFEWP